MQVKVVKHFPEGDVIIKDETVEKTLSRKKKTSPKKEETLSDEDDCQTEQTKE